MSPPSASDAAKTAGTPSSKGGTWVRWEAWLAAVLSLLVTAAAAGVAYQSGYRGIAPAGSMTALCGEAFPVFTARAPAADGTCRTQLANRDTLVATKKADLRIACSRHQSFHESLARNAPEARRAMKEEDAEARRLYTELRELAGPAITADLPKQLGLLVLTIAILIGVTYGAGLQATRAGIPSPTPGDLRRPFYAGAGATFLVAAGVTLCESIDANKTGFDWSSYCTSVLPFWLGHSVLGAMSVVTAAPFAAGWYLSGARHRPAPVPSQPRWGVGKYVDLLETWSFITVVLVGVIAAVWLHTLVAAPSRTNRTIALEGTGALIGAGWLVARFVGNARHLQRTCESLIAQADMKRGDLPADPTEGMLGKKWWQLPTLFVVAGGLAYKLVESAGVSSLVNGSP